MPITAAVRLVTVELEGLIVEGALVPPAPDGIEAVVALLRGRRAGPLVVRETGGEDVNVSAGVAVAGLALAAVVVAVAEVVIEAASLIGAGHALEARQHLCVPGVISPGLLSSDASRTLDHKRASRDRCR